VDFELHKQNFSGKSYQHMELKLFGRFYQMKATQSILHGTFHTISFFNSHFQKAAI